MKSSEKKRLCMRIFHKSKDSRLKDQNKKEIYFLSPAMKTNVNEFFFMTKRNFISGVI